MRNTDEIAQILTARKESLVTAESLTGGLIAEQLTRMPAASEWFWGAFVVYVPQMKQAILEVSRQTIENCGTVSKECVQQMAQGALKKSKASWALAATGVAGPQRYENQAVGSVWMAIAHQGGELLEFKEFFSGDRQAIRQQTADFILNQFLAILKKTRR